MTEIPIRRLMPVVVLPTGKMKRSDINRLNKAGFCTVECDDPASVRFMYPPPGDYNTQEKACIELTKTVLNASPNKMYTRQEIGALLADIVMRDFGNRPQVEKIPVVKAKP